MHHESCRLECVVVEVMLMYNMMSIDDCIIPFHKFSHCLYRAFAGLHGRCKRDSRYAGTIAGLTDEYLLLHLL